MKSHYMLNADEHQEYGLLGCNAVQFGESLTFQRNTLSTSNGFLLSLSFDPEGDNMFLKNVSLSPNGIKTHKTTLVIATAMRTSEGQSKIKYPLLHVTY
jgi:hypothetical protein